MAVKYPKNPRFNRLAMRSPDCRTWQEGCAHDPALLEWEGKYYAYSTDTFGAPSGYQVRESDDLLHWRYVGSAFPLEGTASAYKRGAGGKGAGNLQAAYDWCVTNSRKVPCGVCTRTDGNFSLWAPHCVRGTDGKFWLYFCLTGYFGGSLSCIGLAKSDSPTGGFECKQLLVQSPEGWRTPNAIDPQVFFAEGKMYLVYGSFGMGLYLIELDPATGLRRKQVTYADRESGKCAFEEYYGVQLASGSLEGGAIRYHKDVPVLENGVWTKKNYYYLTCSYGSLSSAYNIRCGRSERPEGPYVDVNGNRLVCSTDLGTGNKLLGSFRWEDAPVDFFCPGHNDLFVTNRGVNLVSYHCRTNFFIERGASISNNFHYLYLGQYAFNSDGWLVMNANRYAGEELQEISEGELLAVSEGKFEAVLFTQRIDTVKAKRIVLKRDGTVEGGYTGSWRLYGGRYVSVTLGTEEYLGVAMPAWQDHRNTAGLTVTALGTRSGAALHLNSTNQI
ncbi:MAG: glycoside hydrolase family 43 protein [Clostridia bacterium]|nr:glycoside hydrolase family 43 protein [Clostridia bacterium]